LQLFACDGDPEVLEGYEDVVLTYQLGMVCY
jgi:hypothetical protein